MRAKGFLRYGGIQGFYTEDWFQKSSRRRPEDFTRKRKMPLEELIVAILQEQGISAYMEAYNYYQKKGVAMTISATAMKNQRMKLVPEIFLKMNQMYLERFYIEEEVRNYHGYLMIGIDGSDLILPTTPELINRFGHSYGKEEHKKTAMATMSTSRDLLNHMTTDCVVERYRTSEREMMRGHLKKQQKIIGNKKTIIVMDRGYYSAAEVANFKIKTKANFVFRIKKTTLKQQREEMKSEDEEIEIMYNNQMIEKEKNKEVQKYMKKKKKERVRLTRIKLKTGEEEYLISDLDEETFRKEDLKAIYHMRWEIETSYNNLKNQMKMESFSGKTEELIKQDVYSAILASNMIQDIVQETTQEINEEKKYKYEMQINRNIATGMWKNKIVRMVTGEEEKNGEKEYNELKEEIKKHLVPIRPGRSNIRKKIKKPRKSHQNKKVAY